MLCLFWEYFCCCCCFAYAKDRVTQTTETNVGKGATIRVNIDKEDASGVKKEKKSVEFEPRDHGGFAPNLSVQKSSIAHLQLFRHG